MPLPFSRHRLRRLPIAVLAVAAGLSVNHQLDRARTTDRLRDTVPVPVASHDLPIGSRIGPESTTLEPWPRALLPDAAVANDQLGRVVTVPMNGGEPILEAKLAPGGRGPVASLLADDEVGIGVPVGPLVGPLTVGDQVEVLAGDKARGDAPSAVAHGRVVAHDEQFLTIAVPDADGPAVARAISNSTIVLAVTP